jgi:hypothetical protein
MILDPYLAEVSSVILLLREEEGEEGVTDRSR